MSTNLGVYPQTHELRTDGDSSLVVSNDFYEIVHDRSLGGAISAIRLLKAGGDNLLLEPTRCHLQAADSESPFSLNDKAEMTVGSDGDATTLTFEGPLLDESGRDSGAVLKVSYIHRWGHVKIRQELQLPPDGIEVRSLLMHHWTVRPELCWFGVRPGAVAEPSNWLWAFGVCQWGRFAPGRSFDSTYESRHVPRYVCLAEPGRRGLEWFVGSQLSQWDYQVAGSPGHGSLSITSTPDPLGMLLRICVLDLPDGRKLRVPWVGKTDLLDHVGRVIEAALTDVSFAK